MKKTKELLHELANNIFQISLVDTWNEKIKIFTDSLNLIIKLRKRKLNDDDCIALKN